MQLLPLSTMKINSSANHNSVRIVGSVTARADDELAKFAAEVKVNTKHFDFAVWCCMILLILSL